MALNLITTTAGRTAIVTAIGTASTIAVKDVQVSDTNQTITVATTALSSVVKTLTTVVGSVRPAGAGHALHLVITDGSADVYAVKALAIRLMDDTVLMAYSQAGDIATKAAGSTLHLAIDLTIDADTAATITFGDTDYALPMAGDTAPGIIELATSAEVITGTDTVRAVTPAGLASLTSTTTRRGIIELATNAEVLAGTDTARAVTPVDLQAKINSLYGLTSAWTGTHSWAGATSLTYATEQMRVQSRSAISMPYRTFSVGDVAVIANSADPIYVTGQTNSAIILFEISDMLEHASALQQLSVGIKPGSARATTNRMALALYSVSWADGVITDHTSGGFPALEDDGTTATQGINVAAATSGDRIVIDLANRCYFAAVKLGNNAAASPDRIFGFNTICYTSWVAR